MRFPEPAPGAADARPWGARGRASASKAREAAEGHGEDAGGQQGDGGAFEDLGDLRQLQLLADACKKHQRQRYYLRKLVRFYIWSNLIIKEGCGYG